MTRPAPGTRYGRPPAPDGMTAGDPFRVLGLAPSADLTDDQVRAAWRRIAAATHPDRSDRGDPAAFATAAAAYTTLRTRSARGEALADLRTGAARPSGRAGRWSAGRPVIAVARLAARIRGGRPGRLALRLLAVAAISGVTWAAIGLQPAFPALITGALTWLIRTGRRDLAPAGNPR